MTNDETVKIKQKKAASIVLVKHTEKAFICIWCNQDKYDDQRTDKRGFRKMKKIYRSYT